MVAQPVEAESPRPPIPAPRGDGRAVRRHVSIHLTPFAPGVGGAAIGDARRWIAQWSVTPVQSLGALLDRLQRSPQAVAIRTVAPDCPDVEVLGRVHGEAEPRILAIVADGLTAGEARLALAELTNGVRR